jgi:hypothetical protein
VKSVMRGSVAIGYPSGMTEVWTPGVSASM